MADGASPDDDMREIGRAACGHHPPDLQEVSALGFKQLIRREDGQTMSEYAVVLAVITPAILAALALLSDRVAARLDFVRAFLS